VRRGPGGTSPPYLFFLRYDSTEKQKVEDAEGVAQELKPIGEAEFSFLTVNFADSVIACPRLNPHRRERNEEGRKNTWETGNVKTAVIP